LVLIDRDSGGHVLSTEHARHGFVRGAREDRLGFAGLKNAALVEYKDLITEQRCFVWVVGNDHHRCCNFALQLSQLPAKPAA